MKMSKKVVPTIGMLEEAYPKIAAIERMKCESPCLRTVKGVLVGVRAICRDLELKGDVPISGLTRHRINMFLAKAAEQRMSPLTAWHYVHCLRGITARWTRPYYEEMGWQVRPFDLPVKRRKAPRYERPAREKLLKVKDWYDSLMIREDRRFRVVAMMMLEFAMRNGDVARLTKANFIERNGCRYLFYKPHKTALSSERMVCWPIHVDLDKELKAFEFPVKNCEKIFFLLNREMRKLGFSGSKGCYELRKICIDHIYQKFGAEMASSISGDDIRTVTRYYADPSAVNVEGVRVVELL